MHGGNILHFADRVFHRSRKRLGHRTSRACQCHVDINYTLFIDVDMAVFAIPA